MIGQLGGSNLEIYGGFFASGIQAYLFPGQQYAQPGSSRSRNLLGCVFSCFRPYRAFTIMRLSAGKIWARNVALFLTALLIITILYHLFADGLSSEQNNIVGLISIAAETVAGLFLLTSKSTGWFKSKIH
ncbi:hypothetical protein [Paraburkholderia fungorum]|uniref:hypothetical protein n=1 Tax=Paraburkholderia fungorum TaxID=134537 RepID=UPI00248F4358|nr:hypothetical protein [Paraburkholderia fungorum]